MESKASSSSYSLRSSSSNKKRKEAPVAEKKARPMERTYKRRKIESQNQTLLTSTPEEIEAVSKWMEDHCFGRLITKNVLFARVYQLYDSGKEGPLEGHDPDYEQWSILVRPRPITTKADKKEGVVYMELEDGAGEPVRSFFVEGERCGFEPYEYFLCSNEELTCEAEGGISAQRALDIDAEDSGKDKSSIVV